MTPDRLSWRLSWVLDAIALFSLVATGEVRVEIFLGTLALLLLSRLLRFKISDKLMLFLLNIVVFSAIGAYFKFHIHPIISSAYAAPFVHGLVWLMQDTIRNRSWRLGIGFVELILASSLTADVYLFVMIFAFIVVAAVALSCAYLESELSVRAPALAKQPLPSGFVGKSLGLACLIFMTSVVIFPLLPRMNVGAGNYGQAQVGYTETVNLNENMKLSMSGRSAQTALWLYPKTEVNLNNEIYLGLIRGRVLDLFDGENWLMSPRRMTLQQQPEIDPHVKIATGALQVDVVRGPIGSEVLPVPYGAVQVFSGPEDHVVAYPRLKSGEWLDPITNQERLHYSFLFYPYRAHVYEPMTHPEAEIDPPLPMNSLVPPKVHTDRMDRLASKIFGRAQDPLEKVELLREFFRRERFAASLGEGVLPMPTKFSSISKLLPIERFLFVNKEGSCEWFASASALLLRMAGVPTRLVAGFRISSNQIGNSLTISNADAHAWVEYWHPLKGWTPFDPTPRVIETPGMFNILRVSYDWVSGYWYRLILGYGEKGESHSSRVSAADGALPNGMNPSLSRWKTEIAESMQVYWEQIVAFVILALAAGLVFYLLLQFKFFSRIFRLFAREDLGAILHERERLEALLARRMSLIAGQSGTIARIRWLFERKSPSVIDDALTELARHKNSPHAESARSALTSWIALYERSRFGAHAEEGMLAAGVTQLRECYKLVKSVTRFS